MRGAVLDADRPAEVAAHHQIGTRVHGGLHLALGGELRQGRHHRMRRLCPEEGVEVARQPRPHQGRRHDLRHPLTRDGTLVEAADALGPERAHQLLRHRLRGHRGGGLDVLERRPHRSGPSGTVGHLVQLALVRQQLLHALLSTGVVPAVGGDVGDPGLGPGLLDHPSAVATRELAGLQLGVEFQHLLRRHVERPQLVQDLPLGMRRTGSRAADQLGFGTVGRPVAQYGLVAGADGRHAGRLLRIAVRSGSIAREGTRRRSRGPGGGGAPGPPKPGWLGSASIVAAWCTPPGGGFAPGGGPGGPGGAGGPGRADCSEGSCGVSCVGR